MGSKLSYRRAAALQPGIFIYEFRLLIFFVVGFVVTFTYFMLSVFVSPEFLFGQNPSESLFNVTDEFGRIISMNPLKVCHGDADERIQAFRQMRVQRQSAWIDLLPDYAMKFYAIQGLYDPTAIRSDELFSFRMDGYNHYFMDFYDKDAPCNVYSFGVDFDFSGLSYLWHRYPQCRLNIADRNIGNSGDLSAALPHAKLHKWTLGGQNGTYESHESKSLSQWFKKNGKRKMIDLLILNLKGNEYSVMSTLAEEIKYLPIVCQLNIRIHFPPQRYGLADIDGILAIWELMKLQGMTIFNAESDAEGLQLFLINMKPHECVRKIFC